MKPLAITAYTLTSALGVGKAVHIEALREGRSGLSPCRFDGIEMPGYIGQVAGLDDVVVPHALAAYDCRNNRLAWLALQQDGLIDAVQAACDRYGAHRVALLLGTSSSGIRETELAYRRRTPDGALPADYRYAETHDASSVAFFTGQALGLRGPRSVTSTACSSGAKVFAAATRMIEAGFVDAALVGAVDSLCLTTLYGFRALELLSNEICRPWDRDRKGLSLAEGAAFSLLERDASPVAWLLGTGESSDAHHMTTPHPQGTGAMTAIRRALADAALAPSQIDYINLHGTATPSNDAAEDRAVTNVFGCTVACSSTKGATGHALGASGAVEAAIGMLALEHGLMPGGLNVRQLDPALGARYITAPVEIALGTVLSNSFGFGGSNACLVLGAAA